MKVKVILSTVPGNACVELPAQFFANDPVVLDAAYMPEAETHLIRTARQHTCTDIIRGIEMLLVQAYKQIEVHTGWYPPARILRPLILSDYEEKRYIL